MNASADKYDVIIVGGGNAAMCAALSAHEQGARVLVLERAPESERGGNSAYTDGAMRFVYDAPDDVIASTASRSSPAARRSWSGAAARGSSRRFTTPPEREGSMFSAMPGCGT